MRQADPNVSAEWWICLKCRTANVARDRFCANCGEEDHARAKPAEKQWRCTGCNALWPHTNLFCIKCGKGAIGEKRAIRPNLKFWLVASGITLAILALYPTFSSPLNVTRGCLAVTHEDGAASGFSSGVTGYVENHCGREFRGVRITYKLFDKQGNVVETVTAFQENLKPDEIWRFRAMGFASDVATFKLEGVSGY